MKRLLLYPTTASSVLECGAECSSVCFGKEIPSIPTMIHKRVIFKAYSGIVVAVVVAVVYSIR